MTLLDYFSQGAGYCRHHNHRNRTACRLGRRWAGAALSCRRRSSARSRGPRTDGGLGRASGPPNTAPDASASGGTPKLAARGEASPESRTNSAGQPQRKRLGAGVRRMGHTTCLSKGVVPGWAAGTALPGRVPDLLRDVHSFVSSWYLVGFATQPRVKYLAPRGTGI